MITSRSRLQVSDDELAHFHNFYEHLVLEEIMLADKDAIKDSDYRSDIACVALNHLPPRYVRHDVDMSFFLSPQEYSEIESKIQKAVGDAIHYVKKNRDYHNQ